MSHLNKMQSCFFQYVKKLYGYEHKLLHTYKKVTATFTNFFSTVSISNSIGRWLQFSNLLDKTIWLWSWKGASPLNLLQWPRKRPFRDDFLSGLTINHIIRYVWGKMIWNICAIFYAMLKISMKKKIWF